MFLCSLRYCLKCYFSKGVYSFTLSTVYIYIYTHVFTYALSVYCQCPVQFIKMLVRAAVRKFYLFVAISVRKPGTAALSGIIFSAWGCDPVFRQGSSED